MATREQFDHNPDYYWLRDEETGRFTGATERSAALSQDVRRDAESEVPAGRGHQGDQPRSNPGRTPERRKRALVGAVSLVILVGTPIAAEALR